MDEKKRIACINFNLRKCSLRWSPRNLTLREAKRKIQDGYFKNGKPRMRAQFKCNECKEWYSSKEVQVDHMTPVGDFKDWNQYIDRLFCQKDKLQVLCKPCHKEKSRNER